MEHTTMTGEDLLFFARFGADELVAPVLIDALKRHMETGASMDTLLGLTAARGGEKTARRNEVLTQRGIHLLCSLEKIRDADPEISLWEVAGIIHDGLRTGHPDFADILELGEQLGLTLSNRESVYRALNRIDPLT